MIRKKLSVSALLLAGSLLGGCAYQAEADGGPVQTGVVASTGSGTEATGDSLRTQFANPPAAARPRVWWHWMNGNITTDGIRKDIEWMDRIGIGGMQTFDANLQTPQVVDRRLVYMTPAWKDAFRYATQLASHYDLELAIASSPGWSITGGPWVEPEDGLKKLVWSEVTVSGNTGQPVSLPRPPETTGPFQDIQREGGIGEGTGSLLPTHYEDVAVLAYPAGASRLPAPTTATSDGASIDDAVLRDMRFADAVDVTGAAQGSPATVTLSFSQPETVRAATVFVPGAQSSFVSAGMKVWLEASEDGRQWRKVADIENSPVPTTVAFESQTARLFRLLVEPVPGGGSATRLAPPAPGADLGFFGGGSRGGPQTARIAEFRLWGDERIDQFERKAGNALAPDYYALSPDLSDTPGVDPGAVLDLSDRLRADNTLDWSPPAGDWRIVRLGYSLTGTTNHPAPPEATGLEVDKFDGDAVRRYIEHYLGNYRQIVGDELMGEDGIRALLTDSIEVGAANWTGNFVEQFKRLRGYDPLPFLPTLTGQIVGSRERSDRFLYDYRRTLSDLMASQHYNTVAEVAHENGLKVYGEALEDKRPSIGDDMAMRSYTDVPMAAMWFYGEAGPRPTLEADIKGAASVAHIYGQNLVAAESLTSAFSPWAHSPADLRPVIDLEFALGVNRPIIHTSVHQPSDDKVPGLSLMMFGQYFNRHETWAEMAGPWVDYMARSAHLLQQGRYFADVAYFYGEEAPITGLYGLERVADAPVRYAYDFANVDVLMNQLSVDNGDLVSPAGARYRVLYLGGSSSMMTLATLSRLAELVEAGATVVGSAPTGSPSLNGDPEAFGRLRSQLWSGNDVTEIGLGKVFDTKDVEAALQQIGVVPDFDYSAQQDDADVMFLHRQLDDGDIYFLSNRNDRAETVEARFRVTGKAPEIWHADTNDVQPISYRTENGVTVATLDFDPEESYFVVFRKSGGKSANIARPVELSPLVTIDGPWSVSFDSKVGAPAPIALSSLSPLNESDEPEIRYFSGIATYETTFAIPGEVTSGTPLMLDLGEVGDLAEVRVNGELVGTVWHAPYRLDIADAARPGTNMVEIRVANLWVNRLIGDAQSGAEKMTFTAMSTYHANAPLRRSGLIGPVVLEGKSR